MSPPRAAVLSRRDSSLGLNLITQEVEGVLQHRVTSVIRGGAASRAGVQHGDRVLSVNGVSIVGQSHEFALAAFSCSIDGEVTIMVENDRSQLCPEATSPPIPLFERKSSHDLLAQLTVSPKKDAPRYDVIGMSPSDSRLVKPTTFVTIQSNPSTGFIGLSLVQFRDGKPRVGGIHPKGPCAATAIRCGDILLSIDDRDVSEASVKEVATILTEKRGKRMTLGLHSDDTANYEVLLTESGAECQTWVQQGEAASIGIKLAATRRGTRIKEFCPAGSHAEYSALRIGDVLVGVNDNDVSGSTCQEILAAFVLSNSPTLTIRRNFSPIEAISTHSIATDDGEVILKNAHVRAQSRRLPSGRSSGRGGRHH
mmetsp:Transcript_17499/g.45747  ORF Transcript_17499/g.45747 Transcript_17499/m.45747 type:complete len:368 (+) Transcript_17499:61-1164(+)